VNHILRRPNSLYAATMTLLSSTLNSAHSEVSCTLPINVAHALSLMMVGKGNSARKGVCDVVGGAIPTMVLL